jgi:hypothetical protein
MERLKGKRWGAERESWRKAPSKSVGPKAHRRGAKNADAKGAGAGNEHGEIVARALQGAKTLVGWRRMRSRGGDRRRSRESGPDMPQEDSQIRTTMFPKLGMAGP